MIFAILRIYRAPAVQPALHSQHAYYSSEAFKSSAMGRPEACFSAAQSLLDAENLIPDTFIDPEAMGSGEVYVIRGPLSLYWGLSWVCFGVFGDWG